MEKDTIAKPIVFASDLSDQAIKGGALRWEENGIIEYDPEELFSGILGGIVILR